MIPRVNINLENGMLGAVGDYNDGVAALVIGCDVGESGITAGDIFTLSSVDDCVENKIADIPFAYQQVKEFYNEAGQGAKLYVLIAENTEVLADLADKASTNKYAKTLLDYAGGEVNLIGICRNPDESYTASLTSGMDEDSEAAITKLQVLANDYLINHNPIIGLVEGREFQGDASSVSDLSEGSDNFVGVVMAASGELSESFPGAASVGLALGRAAAVPVQRKIARVKDGSLSISGAYLGGVDGRVKIENADWEGLATKNYIVVGKYPNKSGYYFIDDTLATSLTDDYSTISRRRAMNKIIRIVSKTYVNELNDDIEIDSEGKIAPAVAKYYQGLIENAVSQEMTANGELSGFSAFVDINQNVLSTGRIDIALAAIPKGYSQEIKVVLGFTNPALGV